MDMNDARHPARGGFKFKFFWWQSILVSILLTVLLNLLIRAF